MKNFRSAGITLIVLSMGFGSIASARDRDPSDRYDRQSERRATPQRNERSADPGHRDQRDQRSGASYRAVTNNHYTYNYSARNVSRGAGPSQNFRQGGYLPVQYRSRTYVVDNWRGRQLSAPPRGYHWVQTGGDYVLAAIATGLIVNILLNH